MKTGFFIILIGIILASTIIVLSSYGGAILFDEHYEIEIIGLDDIYTTEEVYFFDYNISGYGDACAKITVNYPDENGKTITKTSIPSCVAERNFISIDTNSFSGILGNVTVKIPGKYSVSVTYEPIGSLLSATKTKEFEIVPVNDDYELFTKEKRVKVEGKIAEEICIIMGGGCPSYYIGNIQEDGSVMVGITISDTIKEKQFIFFIKNNTLSYEIKQNEN